MVLSGHASGTGRDPDGQGARLERQAANSERTPRIGGVHRRADAVEQGRSSRVQLPPS